MLRHMLERGIEREIYFYWGARAAVDLYEEALLLDWAGRFPFFRYTAVLSHTSAAEAQNRHLGFVHEAVLARHADLAGFDIYAAGPPALIEVIRATFPQSGARADGLYFDSFDFAPKSSAFNR
jgi:CDP-4-dehydro-6-deoxyglucose reductase